jgi:hypothetical protein
MILFCVEVYDLRFVAVKGRSCGFYISVLRFSYEGGSGIGNFVFADRV